MLSPSPCQERSVVACGRCAYVAACWAVREMEGPLAGLHHSGGEVGASARQHQRSGLSAREGDAGPDGGAASRRWRSRGRRVVASSVRPVGRVGDGGSVCRAATPGRASAVRALGRVGGRGPACRALCRIRGPACRVLCGTWTERWRRGPGVHQACVLGAVCL